MGFLAKAKLSPAHPWGPPMEVFEAISNTMFYCYIHTHFEIHWGVCIIGSVLYPIYKGYEPVTVASCLAEVEETHDFDVGGFHFNPQCIG